MLDHLWCGIYQQTIFVWIGHLLSKLQPKMENFGHNLNRSPLVQLATENGELQSQVG
jgi:hypothetical protein